MSLIPSQTASPIPRMENRPFILMTMMQSLHFGGFGCAPYIASRNGTRSWIIITCCKRPQAPRRAISSECPPRIVVVFVCFQRENNIVVDEILVRPWLRAAKLITLLGHKCCFVFWCRRCCYNTVVVLLSSFKFKRNCLLVFITVLAVHVYLHRISK